MQEEKSKEQHDEFEIPSLGSDKCSYPVRGLNKVWPLVDGHAAWSTLFDLLSNVATKSLWVAVSFFNPHWSFQGVTFFDKIKEVANKGIEVRILFWKPGRLSPDTEEVNPVFTGTFRSCENVFAWLRENKIDAKIRWDESGEDYRHSHHEKTWIIDAFEPSAYTICGGIIPSPPWNTTPDHTYSGHSQQHDINVLMQGPSTIDIAHSFVQRWNEALHHDSEFGSYPSLEEADYLPFPTLDHLSAVQEFFEEKGKEEGHDVNVQVQRTIRAKGYFDNTSTPDGDEFDIKNGEQSIFDQYKLAIKNAKRTIYMENSHVAHPKILQLFREALERGVQIIYVVTGALLQEHMSETFAKFFPLICGRRLGSVMYTMERCFKYLKPPKRSLNKSCYSEAFLEKLAALKKYPNFSLVGLAVNQELDDGTVRYHSVGVHSKLIMIDDEFFTCGSANNVDLSFNKDHTELNIAVWHKSTATWLRKRLFAEHLCWADQMTDFESQDPVEILKSLHKEMETQQQQNKKEDELDFELFRTLANDTTANFLQQNKPLPRHAYTLDPEFYATIAYGVSLYFDYVANY